MPKPLLDIPRDVSDFHEIGRFLHYSNRVTSNELARRTLCDASAVDAASIAHLQAVVYEVLAKLSSRQRTIIERYDFADEAYTVVAEELGVSTRHFWREHREAHAHIAAELRRYEASAVAPPTITNTDVLERHLDLSRVLENNGRWEQSVGLLESIANDTLEPERRIDIELRLSGVYRDVERFSLAQHHAEVAHSLAGRLDPLQRWREFEADAALAQIYQATGDGDRAANVLHTSSAQLRSWAHDVPGVEAALADTLWQRAILYSVRADLESAENAAREALEITKRLPYVPAKLSFFTRWAAATLDLLKKRSSAETQQELLECYGEGIAHGLTRDSLYAASSVAAAYRFASAADKAMTFLLPLIDTTKIVGPCEATRSIYLELVRASIELGNLREALAYLGELGQPSKTDPGSHAVALLLAARIHGALGEHHAALSSAESAETLFMRLGYARHIAAALLVQAQALIALGNYTQARRVLPVVVERAKGLNDSGFLATTYELFGAAFDDPKYLTQARKLRLH